MNFLLSFFLVSLVPSVGATTCVDRNEYCDAYMHLGYCRREHVHFMIANCYATCVFSQEQGFDSAQQEHQHCGYWAEKGHCTGTDSGNNYSPYMKINCPHACGFCNETTKGSSVPVEVPADVEYVFLVAAFTGVFSADVTQLEIVTLGTGDLRLGSVALEAGGIVPITSIENGELKFTGSADTTVTFKVLDAANVGPITRYSLTITAIPVETSEEVILETSEEVILETSEEVILETSEEVISDATTTTTAAPARDPESKKKTGSDNKWIFYLIGGLILFICIISLLVAVMCRCKGKFTAVNDSE